MCVSWLPRGAWDQMANKGEPKGFYFGCFCTGSMKTGEKNIAREVVKSLAYRRGLCDMHR